MGIKRLLLTESLIHLSQACDFLHWAWASEGSFPYFINTDSSFGLHSLLLENNFTITFSNSITSDKVQEVELKFIDGHPHTWAQLRLSPKMFLVFFVVLQWEDLWTSACADQLEEHLNVCQNFHCY